MKFFSQEVGYTRRTQKISAAGAGFVTVSTLPARGFRETSDNNHKGERG